MNMMAAISTDPASTRRLPRQVEQTREQLAQAFRDLEPSVCDLTRLALLAERQLHRAIGDLKHENEICVEVPDTEDAELATLAVSLLAEKVRELKREWYRRFDTATEVARQAG